MLPIHPILVHFPVSLVTVALGADVIGQLRPSADARALGFWCLVVAVLGAAGAVAAGHLDMYRADLAEHRRSCRVALSPLRNSGVHARSIPGLVRR
jgi:uncharacterized membrane protein